MRGEFVDDVAHVMHLPLPRDVARDAAGVLDVLLPVEHLPDRVRLLAHRIPQMHREDQRVLARIVVEDRLGRRVGENAAVPIELAVDAHGRKRRRQRTGRHDVLDADLGFAAVEVTHLAGAHVRGADREPRLAVVDQREVDQFVQRLLQRRGRVEAGAIGAERDVRRGMRTRVRLEESGNAARTASSSRRSCPESRSRPGKPERRRLRSIRRQNSSQPRPGDPSARLPAIRLALMAPIEVPMIQSGSMPASCSA